MIHYNKLLQDRYYGRTNKTDFIKQLSLVLNNLLDTKDNEFDIQILGHMIKNGFADERYCNVIGDKKDE